MSIGYPCIACGGRTDVKDSRPRVDAGGIRRRRFCPGCGARFTTFEIRAEDVDSVLLGVQDREPIVLQQATGLVNILGRLTPEDRILLLGVARRFEDVLTLSRRLRGVASDLEDAA